MGRYVYKILARADWDAARVAGVYRGSSDDRRDGFIHFSTAAQAPRTARKFFANQAGLVVLKVDANSLGDALKWEPAADGDLFPHVYAQLAVNLVSAEYEAPLDAEGIPTIGTLE